VLQARTARRCLPEDLDEHILGLAAVPLAASTGAALHRELPPTGVRSGRGCFGNADHSPSLIRTWGAVRQVTQRSAHPTETFPVIGDLRGE
jgi:hypothetical protein